MTPELGEMVMGKLLKGLMLRVSVKFPTPLLSTLLRVICMETRRGSYRRENKNENTHETDQLMLSEEVSTYPKPSTPMIIECDKIPRTWLNLLIEVIFLSAILELAYQCPL